MVYFSTLFISLLLTVVTIPPLTRLAKAYNFIDQPDGRKTHKVPVPRCGGIAMAFGALTPTAYWFANDPFILSFLLAASCIVFFGIADDFFGLSPRWKFLGQIVAALIVIFLGDVQIANLGFLLPDETKLPDWIAIPLTVLVLVGVTNAVNLSDGLDGLAGGISLMNVCLIGYLAVLTNTHHITLASLALTGAIFGFLRFNTHPASIFMGDSGSQLLGFAAITFSLVICQENAAISPLVPLLLFGLPVLDTLTVMTTRILNHQSPFSPDRRHFHHRLLSIGFGHAEAVVVIYVLQALLVSLAFILRFQSGELIFCTYLLFSSAVLLFFYYANKVGWLKKRWSVLDQIKDWYKSFRGKRHLLSICFPSFRFLMYGLIVAIGVLPPKSPPLVAWSLLALGIVLLLLQLFKSNIAGLLVRTVFFILVPLVIYSGSDWTLQWSGIQKNAYNLLFILLFLLSIVVSVLSTRKKGIWSTPLDFLILLLMIIVPNLAGINIQSQNLGMVGLQSLIMIISFEVLLAEMRAENKGVTVAMVLSLVTYAVRSFF